MSHPGASCPFAPHQTAVEVFACPYCTEPVQPLDSDNPTDEPDLSPSPKSPEMEALLERIGGRSTAMAAKVCLAAPIGCDQPITGFRDAGSVSEYRISGLCQACQDSVFGTGEDE